MRSLVHTLLVCVRACEVMLIVDYFTISLQLASPAPSPLLSRSVPPSPAPGTPHAAFLPRDLLQTATAAAAVGSRDAPEEVVKRETKSVGKAAKRRSQKNVRSRKLASRIRKRAAGAAAALQESDGAEQTLTVHPSSQLEARRLSEPLLNDPPVRRYPLELSEGTEAVEEFLEDRSLENAVVDERSGFISVDHHEPATPRSVFRSFVEVLGPRALRLYERGQDGQAPLDATLKDRTEHGAADDSLENASPPPSPPPQRRAVQEAVQPPLPIGIQSKTKADKCARLHARALQARDNRQSLGGLNADLLGRRDVQGTGEGELWKRFAWDKKTIDWYAAAGCPLPVYNACVPGGHCVSH